MVTTLCVVQCQINDKRPSHQQNTAVGEELPCQRVQIDSDDPFIVIVAVTKGEMIEVSHSQTLPGERLA